MFCFSRKQPGVKQNLWLKLRFWNRLIFKIYIFSIQNRLKNRKKISSLINRLCIIKKKEICSIKARLIYFLYVFNILRWNFFLNYFVVNKILKHINKSNTNTKKLYIKKNFTNTNFLI